MAKKRNKALTPKQAAEQLTAIAEKHLSGLPEEEQDLRGPRRTVGSRI